jgi:hypothetical protein
MRRLKVYLLILIFFTDCTSKSEEKRMNLGGAQGDNIQTKEFSSGNLKIRAKIDNEGISFEVFNDTNSKTYFGINEFGKLTFSNCSPFVAYNENKITTTNFVFLNGKFALLPFEDWNGNQIIYSIPLELKNNFDSIPVLAILKERYCLFNERTGTLLTYNVQDREYFISEQSYFISEFNIYHFKGDTLAYKIGFYTQKQLNIPEEISPNTFREVILGGIQSFYQKEVFNAYFK